MSRIPFFFVAICLALLAFIFDSQLPAVLIPLLPSSMFFSSHLVLIILLFWVQKSDSNLLYLVFLCLGFLTDDYFYHTIGISIFIYPLIVYLTRKHKGLINLPLTRYLMFLVLIFLFEGISYMLAWIYGLTRQSIEFVVTHHLLFTILVNSVIMLFTNPIFQKINKESSTIN